MTVYFMGGEIGSFTASDNSSGEVASAPSLGYNGSYARTALKNGDALSSITSLAFAAPDTFWLHCDFATANNSSSFRWIYLSTSTTDVVRFGVTTTSMKVQALISAVWTDVIPETTVPFGFTRHLIDMKVIGNSASGSIALYIDGQKRDEQTADLSAVVGVEHIIIKGSTGYGGSQFVISDEPTISGRLMTYVPTGAGASTDFVGDYSRVDEKQNSDADFISSGTANDVELFTTTPEGSINGYLPVAVGVYCRARCGEGGPQNLQLALRSSGTTYFSGSKALDVGFESYGHVWNVDPANSAPFLSASIAALQPGVKSVA